MIITPPKQKFTRDEIIAAALDIVRLDGITGITARGLGAALGSSARPIFTVFKNMEEVQRETRKAARAVYNGYIQKGLCEKPAFKGTGMQYIRFAKEEPRLFQLLFMTASGTTNELSDILPVIDENGDRILASIQEEYGLKKEPSYKLYQYLWLFTHGIASLCATNVGHLTETEASEILTDVFIGMLSRLKGQPGGKDDD